MKRQRLRGPPDRALRHGLWRGDSGSKLERGNGQAI